MTDPADIADSSDSSENADPMLNADAKDPTDPIDKAEPTDPIDRTDPREPIDRTESCDHRDHLDEEFIGAILHTGPSPARAAPSARLITRPARVYSQVLADGRDETGFARGTTGGGATAGGGVTRGGAETRGGALSSGGGVTRGGAETTGRGVTSGAAETEGGAETTGGAVTEGGAVTSGGGVTAGGAETAGRGGMGVWSASPGDAAGPLRAPAAVPGSDGALLVSSMLAPALAAARVLRSAGTATVVLCIPAIKPPGTPHGQVEMSG